MHKNRGKKRTPEQRMRISLAKKGKPNGLLGKKHSAQTRIKMSKARIGISFSNEHKQKLSLVKIGKPSNQPTGFKHSDETKKRLGLVGKSRIGELHPRWIQDRSNLKRFNDVNKDRRSYAYTYWRKCVWLRDNWKCRMANSECFGRIEAHHILGWTNYPELRYEVNNGITLCHFHHPRKRNDEERLVSIFKELVLNQNV